MQQITLLANYWKHSKDDSKIKAEANDDADYLDSLING